jgi:tripeptidyl-peptidase I
LYNFSAGTTSFSGNEMGIGEGAGCLNLPDLPIFFKNYTEPEIPADTVPESSPLTAARQQMRQLFSNSWA